MRNEEAHDHLPSLKLWGDGDELGALQDVEERFGVKLDYSGGDEWWTVGDVYADLLKVLPKGVTEDPHTWAAFAQAISQETGVDPLKVAPETLLIDRSGSPWLSMFVVAAILVGLAAAFSSF